MTPSPRDKFRRSTRKSLGKKASIHSSKKSKTWLWIGSCVALGGILLAAALVTNRFQQAATPTASMDETRQAIPSLVDKQAVHDSPTRYFAKGNLTLVWDKIKPDIQSRLRVTSQSSNIHPSDYVGPDRCKDCHANNYADWFQHPHRLMNALAIPENVLGDFSGDSRIQYQGGEGKFYRDGQRYMMSYQREGIDRIYEISQTIGSRFYQYYIGKGLQGPEPPEHDYYHQDHVLPFGFWIDRKAWVPIVHVHDELPDHLRWESALRSSPVSTPAIPSNSTAEISRSRGIFNPLDELPLTYARACNFCHTTFPLADMFIRMPDTIGKSLPSRSIFSMNQYVAQSHPSLWDGRRTPESLPSDELQAMTGKFIRFEAPQRASTLGISCEACHLGCRIHADNKEIRPSFKPHSPWLFEFADAPIDPSGRTQENVNSMCARCHVGDRPKFAGGMSTWNSTEFSDAIQGACYSQLTCILCHDPHQPIGKQWQKPPSQDDAVCLQCHQQFSQDNVRQNHTHHASGSEGDRCMNCHMPKLNEGIQDVVRTHTIFSPTNASMLEANHPNACNLCHLDRPIDWTLGYLKSWYGKSYSEIALARNYPQRSEPMGLSWLHSNHEPTRLVGAAAVGRQKAQWALPALLELLNDDYLLNRQFAQTSVESLLGTPLNQRFQYWYYMTKKERQEPIENIRAWVQQR